MATLTTTDAATALGLTPGRVRQLIRAGQIPAVKAGRDWLIEETDVEAARIRKDGRQKGVSMYTVKGIDKSGEIVMIAENLTESEATETADEMARENGVQVFASFHRRSDGQVGYLNRDGHSPVGKAW